MLHFRLFFLISALFLNGFLSSSCGGGGSSDSGGSTSDGTLELVAQCGVINNGALLSEVESATAERVRVQALNPDVAVVTRLDGSQAGSEQLIKLLGIDTAGITPKLIAEGRALVAELSKGFAYLLLPNRDVQQYIDPSGAEGVYGQLFSSAGESIAEHLLEKSFVVPTVNGLFSDQLYDCYSSLDQVADTSAEYVSACGVISAGQIYNPVKGSYLELVSVSAKSSDFVVVTSLEGAQAGQTIGVILHGVTSEGVDPYYVEEGRKLIANLTAANAYMLLAGENCVYTNATGDQATLAQLFTLDGKNMSEVLLASGAVVASNNGCSADKLTTCYSDIPVDKPPLPDEIDSGNGDNEDHDEDEGDVGDYPDTVIDDFLWKPVSESSGNLVVLVNVKGVRVRVEGAVVENLVDTGPSNGRGTTARASRPGCAYGKNITVKFFDSSDQALLTKDGKKTVKISNGCNRVEWKL